VNSIGELNMGTQKYVVDGSDYNGKLVVFHIDITKYSLIEKVYYWIRYKVEGNKYCQEGAYVSRVFQEDNDCNLKEVA
jgi:hypothetical protein